MTPSAAQRYSAATGEPLPPGVLYELPYMSAYGDAEQRLRRGERQLFCLSCHRWRWADQCIHEDRMVAKEYHAMIRRVVRETKRKYPTQEQRYRAELRKHWRELSRAQGGTA